MKSLGSKLGSTLGHAAKINMFRSRSSDSEGSSPSPRSPRSPKSTPPPKSIEPAQPSATGGDTGDKAGDTRGAAETGSVYFGNPAKTLSVAMQLALIEQQMAQPTSAPHPPQRQYQRQAADTAPASSSGSSYSRSCNRGGGYASKSKGKYPSRGGGGKKKSS